MNLPALWHRLRGAGVSVPPPEVSAIAATSGYCLPTLRVEERGSSKGLCNFAAVVVIGVAVLATSCKREEGVAERTQTNAGERTNQQVFQVKGVVISVKP